VHLHPQQAGPKIPSSLNGPEKVAISSLRVLLIVCVPDLGIEAVQGVFRKGPTFFAVVIFGSASSVTSACIGMGCTLFRLEKKTKREISTP
jgi:hypothetical protein